MKENSLVDNYIFYHEEIMLLITQILSLLVSNQNPGYPTKKKKKKKKKKKTPEQQKQQHGCDSLPLS